MTALRAWQERALARMSAWEDGPFLLSAAPGAGKTIPSLVFAEQLLRAGTIRRVAVVCPTTPLTRQWAEAAGRLGVQLAPDAGELRPPADFHGVAVTYARVAASAARWAPQCTARTLVIADEAHHLGEELAWGEGFARAFAATPRWLLLSGTPFRSDQTPIPGVRYEDGVAEPERRTRLRDKRHGLVSTLRGLDGRSHREINAWLNRETGVTRVDDASLPQLERSISLLLSELDRLSRRRGAS